VDNGWLDGLVENGLKSLLEPGTGDGGGGFLARNTEVSQFKHVHVSELDKEGLSPPTLFVLRRVACFGASALLLRFGLKLRHVDLA